MRNMQQKRIKFRRICYVTEICFMVCCFWFKFFGTELGLDIARKRFLVHTLWFYCSKSCSTIAFVLICRRWFSSKVWTFFYCSHFRSYNFRYYLICNVVGNTVIPCWIYSSLPDYDFRTMLMLEFKRRWLKTKRDGGNVNFHHLVFIFKIWYY